MFRILFAAMLYFVGLTSLSQAQTVFIDQGSSWTSDLRAKFYVQDQGARIMPITWMRALLLPDGNKFLHDSLARYGYLPLANRLEGDLPVGFTTNNFQNIKAVGMSCAACHTRQIDVNGTPYRIDGGPAIVDFQSFLKDLDDAVLAILGSASDFDVFATSVLGAGATNTAKTTLKNNVSVWSNRYHTLIERSLPDPAWGPSRLDAISMIFNRVAGLDIGTAADEFLIPENIAKADAPARYPFLWNAARQDRTQWPGFAENGNALLGLARNLGEVYGVFGEFHPTKQNGLLFDRDFITNNSADWKGLKSLEDWIWDIGPPKWPWGLNQHLAKEGKAIFDLPESAGGCVSCHGERKGAFRSILHSTFATPVLDVGTDIRECQVLARRVKTGILEGAKIPLIGDALGAEATAIEVLSISVVGAIIQHALQFDSDVSALESDLDAIRTDIEGYKAALPHLQDLRGAFPAAQDVEAFAKSSKTKCKYEARVLHGIWAAAPFLHNGSVPTLTELLTKPADRVKTFMPGPNYNIIDVGMAATQTKFSYVTKTTGCDDLASGNSNCGHSFGTDLGDNDKRALLEYLKSL
ncbi:MAG: hypothetical protein JKY99_08505 [Rhizobiales bacterium]|nr:hypothetical protein [Hyphomicrobiales bacterium]